MPLRSWGAGRAASTHARRRGRSGLRQAETSPLLAGERDRDDRVMDALGRGGSEDDGRPRPTHGRARRLVEARQRLAVEPLECGGHARARTPSRGTRGRSSCRPNQDRRPQEDDREERIARLDAEGCLAPCRPLGRPLDQLAASVGGPLDPLVLEAAVRDQVRAASAETTRRTRSGTNRSGGSTRHSASVASPPCSPGMLMLAMRSPTMGCRASIAT